MTYNLKLYTLIMAPMEIRVYICAGSTLKHTNIDLFNLHDFCDALMRVLCTTMYKTDMLMCTYQEVVPIMRLINPRLELHVCGTKLLAQLLHYIPRALCPCLAQ